METKIDSVLLRKHNGWAFFLAFVPGLIAIYGLGHIYLGKTRRGLEFLASASIPFGLIGISLVWPQIPWFFSTIAWFTLWIWQWIDVSRLTRRMN